MATTPLYETGDLQLTDGSVNRLYKEPTLAYSKILCGIVIWLRNKSERWAEVKYA